MAREVGSLVKEGRVGNEMEKHMGARWEEDYG